MGKNLGKVVLYTVITLLLVIIGFCIFSEKYKDGTPIFVLLSILIVFMLVIFAVLVEINENDVQQNIRMKKLEKLNEIAKTFKTIPTDSAVNKQLEEIHDELEKINKNFEKLKIDKEKTENHIAQLETKMKELKDILTPLDFNSDMFKAYVNAVAEI